MQPLRNEVRKMAAEDCGKLIKQISDEMRKQANNDMRAQNITLAQMSVLLELNSTPTRQLTLKELEQRLHVAQSTAAGIVSRLEQKGFVAGLGDAADRRIKMVRLTESGTACVLNARQGMASAEARLLSGLTETEQEIFCALLKKVCHTLK